MNKIATLSSMACLLVLVAPGCSSAKGMPPTDAGEGEGEGASVDGGTSTMTPPQDSGSATPPGNTRCNGSVSGALSGTFRCTLTLDRFAPRAKLVFALLGQPTGSITGVSASLRPMVNEFTAPRTFQQYDIDRDSLVEIDGGGKAYLTGGLRSANGDSLQLDLRSLDPVSLLSGYYPLPETHGTLDGLLVDQKATMTTDGGADSLTLHIDF